MNSPRNDFVNNINKTDDGPDAITGCALLFIYYLFSQLGYTENQIVGAGAPALGRVYNNLTGDKGDPFPYFKALVDSRLSRHVHYPGPQSGQSLSAGETAPGMDMGWLGLGNV